MSAISHDGHIRSDWLPVGLGRAAARRLCDRAVEVIKERGDYDDLFLSRHHSGRRGGNEDGLSVTSPGGWRELHGGSSTVKIRGCDGFRAYARRLLVDVGDELVASGAIR